MSNSQFINFHHLHEAANSVETIQAILSDAYGIQLTKWRKSGNSYHVQGIDGLNIFSNNGNFFIKDFSGATIGSDATTNAFGLVKLAYNLTGKDAAEKLSKFTGKSLEYVEGNTAPQERTPPTQSFILPNTGEYKNYFESVEYCDFSTEYGKSVFEYCANKTKANESFIRQFYRPITATTKDGNRTEYNANKLAFAVIEGQQAKIFRPYLKSKKYDKLPLKMGKNWLFGFSNLPLQCEYIFLLGGENDTVSFNSAFNSFGWYAVTKGGEGYKYEPQLITLLQAKCKAVFSLFDNDKTGGANMEKQAKEHGLQSIDLATYINDPSVFQGCNFDEYCTNLTVNDVCDFIHHLGSNTLKNVIKAEIRTKKIESVLPYRPTFASVWKTELLQYLGDIPSEYNLLKEYITTGKKLVLSSPTGTGKTTAFLNQIANDSNFLIKLGIERIVYFVHTNSIGEQQAKAYKIPFLTSLFKENNDEINQSKVIAATYDQAHKIPSHWFNNTLFICDEIHTLISEFSYRAATMRNGLELLKSSKYFVGITATPNREFIKRLGLSYCVSSYKDNSKAQKLDFKPILIKKGSAKDLLKDILLRRNKSKKTVVIHNNFNELKAFETILKQEFNQDAVTLISSKYDEYHKENQEYESLKNTGEVSAKTEFILTTKFLETGVNFEFEAEIFCIYPESTASLLQGVARPRFDRKTGINSVVTCFVYLKTEANKEAVQMRFKAFLEGKGYNVPSETETHLSDLKTAFENAENVCKVWNNEQYTTTEDERKKNANSFGVFFNEKTRLWDVDELAILSKAESNLQGILKKDIVSFFAEIQAFNENANIQDIDILTLKKDEDVREAHAEVKAEKEQNILTIAGKLSNYSTKNDVLLLAYAQSHTKTLKDNIKNILQYSPTKPELQAVKNRLPNTDGGEACAVVSKYLEVLEAANMVQYANRTKPISKHDIDTNFVSIIQDFDLIKGRLIRLSERLLHDRGVKDRRGIDSYYNGKISNAIRKQVFEVTTKNHHKKTCLNKRQMINIFNTALRSVYLDMNIKKAPSEKNFDIVRQTFLELFNIETKRTKNGFVYKIGDEITAKNALSVSKIC